MDNFVTGLFTLLAALGGIWLNDHLDQKKVFKSTRKQKAVEAYALAGKLMSSLTVLTVICSNLIQDKNYAYADMYNNNPNTSSDILEKLELIIVENFYDLTIRLKLLEVETTVNSYSRYLFNIMTTIHNQSFQLDSAKFTKETTEFDQSLVQTCHNLRSSLIEYINITAPRITFYTLLESAEQRIKLFFTR